MMKAVWFFEAVSACLCGGLLTFTRVRFDWLILLGLWAPTAAGIATGSSPPSTRGEFFQLNFDRDVTFVALLFHEGDILWNGINANPRDVEPKGDISSF